MEAVLFVGLCGVIFVGFIFQAQNLALFRIMKLHDERLQEIEKMFGVTEGEER